jgi:hypothetical protein
MPGYEVISCKEIDEVQDVLAQGGVLFRQGFDGLRNNYYKVRQFEQEFAKQNGTSDALVLLAADSLTALRCRQQLLQDGLATKILPEAYSWHFDGTWQHIPGLLAAHSGNLQTAFPKSHAAILSRTVSTPVVSKMTEDAPLLVSHALDKALQP